MRKIQWFDFARLRILAFLALLMVFALACGNAHAYVVKQGWARVSAVAGEALATGQVVCLKDADGKAYKADANDTALRPSLGIVGKAAASGESVEIIVLGVLSGWTSQSEGVNVYLSETAGAVTQSAPTYAQVVGVALSTTETLFNFRNYQDTSTLTALGTLTGATPIILEGATANDFETTISPTDPTADRTITVPDKSVTLASTVLVVTADANGKSVAAAEAGDMQSCGGAGVWALPEASTCIGCIFDLAVTAAANVDINPADGDLILGLTDAAGDAIRCAAAGGSIRLAVLDATNIVALGAYCPGGAWADVN